MHRKPHDQVKDLEMSLKSNIVLGEKRKKETECSRVKKVGK